jgi:plasmid stabilization system protein ParE
LARSPFKSIHGVSFVRSWMNFRLLAIAQEVLILAVSAGQPIRLTQNMALDSQFRAPCFIARDASLGFVHALDTRLENLWNHKACGRPRDQRPPPWRRAAAAPRAGSARERCLSTAIRYCGALRPPGAIGEHVALGAAEGDT